MPFSDAIRIGSSGAVDTAYAINQSLRFNSTDNANLTRTSSSASTTFTYSAWIKRTKFTGYQYIFSMAGRGFAFHTTYNTFYLYDGNNLNQSTNAYRDPNAWYHIVVQINSGVATSYVNNVLVHNGIGSGFTLTTGTNATRIGVYDSGDYDFDGYMAEINLVDGSVVAPSSFGETNADTGQWNPIKYTGGYGTNGFYLNFSDNSDTTATTLGKDSSGNSNNFTPTNFALYGGDVVKDSPSNNFATLQMMGTPFSSGASFSEGNLRLTSGSSSSARNLNRQAFAPMLVNSGKWYAEFMHKDSTGSGFIGIGTYQVRLSTTSNNSRYAYVRRDGKAVYRTAGSETIATYGSAISQYDVVGIYLDMDAGTPVVYFSKNGQWADGSGNFDESNPTSGITLGDSFFTTDNGEANDGFAAFILSSSDGSTSVIIQANFGQDSTFSGQITSGGNTDANGKGNFKYAVPSGAKALCSANLPEPTILLANKHFDTLLWSGNSTKDRNITGLNFSPDWVWIKSRSHSVYAGTLKYNHVLFDTLRGVGLDTAASSSRKELTANEPYVEGNATNLSNYYGHVSAFNSDGYTLDHITGQPPFLTNMTSGRTYVGWNWNAGDSDGKTYTVTVVNSGGNKYRFDGFGTNAVTLDLAEGGTYIFNYPSAHPFRFSTTSDGTHGGGSEYTTGVTHNSSTQVTIVVPASAPTLYYYCSLHSGMGGAINTNVTSGSSNFDGTRQAVVKVNQTAGFSIGLFTAQTSGSATVGHGLGVAPDVVFTKSRDSTSNWYVYHQSIGQNGWVFLDSNSVATTGNSAVFNPAPTSSVFTYGSGLVNQGNVVFYAFSGVEGFSKFGSYKGNGNSDGRFIFLNFRPALVIMKNLDTVKHWGIFDNKRIGYNPENYALFPSDTSADDTSDYIDFLSNGFKIRSTAQFLNKSGDTFVYFCFAESPFKNARAR